MARTLQIASPIVSARKWGHPAEANGTFTGWLMLPEAVIRELGLVKIGSLPATVASGEMEHFAYYRTRIVWHGRFHWVEVLESVDQPLLGMELLRDNWITMGAWDGGDVLIDETRP